MKPFSTICPEINENQRKLLVREVEKFFELESEDGGYNGVIKLQDREAIERNKLRTQTIKQLKDWILKGSEVL
jgi:hypothetical protein